MEMVGHSRTKSPEPPPPYSFDGPSGCVTSEYSSISVEGQSDCLSGTTQFNQDIGGSLSHGKYRSPRSIKEQRQGLDDFLRLHDINLDAIKGQWSSYVGTSVRSKSIITIQFSCPHQLQNCCCVKYQLLKNKESRILVGQWSITKYKYYRPQPLKYLADMLLAGDEPSFWEPYLSQKCSYYDTNLKPIRKPDPSVSFQRLNLTNNTFSRDSQLPFCRY